MKLFRVSFIPLIIFALLVTFSIKISAQPSNLRVNPRLFFAANYESQNFLDFYDLSFSDFRPIFNENSGCVVVQTPTDGGIKEEISAKYQERYQSWKDEFLSTEFGRGQWKNYSLNKNFILRITVGGEEGQGAGTGRYEWNEAGELVGATINLGNKLDRGLPNAVYFPVMNSLSSEEPKYKISGNLLAAAKLAHEFGHVNQTAKMNGELFKLQNKLMPIYNEILLKNGYDVNDKNLIELTKQMGGTPVEIWENREYWGETNALLYLVDRINRENFCCSVLGKIKRNIMLYAKDYEERFDQIEDTSNFESVCR